jgi:uncharacterized protein YrrD
MKRSSEIIGLSIISIAEGKELGTAKDLVIDATTGEVAAVVVEDGKWYLGAKILPFKLIQGIGEYALTVENSNVVVALSAGNDMEKMLEIDVRVKGTKVLTMGGKMQGQVTEILLDEQSGKILACEIRLVNGELAVIPAEQVITFGKDVLVTLDETVQVPVVAAPPVTTRIASAPPVISEQAVAAPVLASQNVTAPVLAPQAVAAHVLAAQAVAHPVLAAQAAANPAVAAQAVAAHALAVQAAANPVLAVKPAVAAQAVAVAEVAAVGTEAAKEDLTRKFDEQHRKFVLGKKTMRRIEEDNGKVIIEQGGEITDEVIQKAKAAGKFVELTMSIAP